MNRREFLAGSAFAVAASGIAPRVLAGATTPGVFTSYNGLLRVALQAGEGWVTVAGRSAYLETYNGLLPGPRLEVRPGDRVKIRFFNRLSQGSNLHYHGMHLSPTGTADNIFLMAAPGASLNYDFPVPTDHPAGLFWYHAHMHGTVAEQVSRGLAGLLVVRGDIDVIPEVAAAREQFLVLQDWSLDASGHVIPPTNCERMRGREGPLITVSGRTQPSFTIQQGGLLRLRILNASVSRFYRLALEQHPMNIIATDGGGLPAPVTLDELLVLPGERIDVLIQGAYGAGTYRLLSLPYERCSMQNGMPMDMGGGMTCTPPAPQTAPLVLATITYRGKSKVAWGLPSQLVDVPPLVPGQIARTFTLSHGMNGGRMSFLINGLPFDATRVDSYIALGSTEDWTYINNTCLDHPMHQHVNWFQIIGPDGQPERAWRDTVLVKGNSSAQIRVKFRDFAGLTVQHCHILDHEDLDMMSTMLIA